MVPLVKDTKGLKLITNQIFNQIRERLAFKRPATVLSVDPTTVQRAPRTLLAASRRYGLRPCELEAKMGSE